MPHAQRRVRRSVTTLTALIACVLSGVALVATQPANADTVPDPGTPATVSADALPTWQVNGVVWSQVVVGNTVYATGSFSKARPPGVGQGGAGEVNAGNIFAYDIRTGARVTSFNHTLNGQGLALTASPDGSRIYVVGDFTAVDGVSRGHIAAFNTSNGSLVSGFAPTLSNQVAAVTANDETVWVGGNFFNANGSGRRRLASFNASNGSLRPWAPKADDEKVQSMVLAPDGTRVIIGGKFKTINGQSANGMGSVDAVSGENRQWLANELMRNGGTGSSISTLRTDGVNIYGSGWAFQTGNFEGAFSAKPDNGEIVWANDCHGDTYDVFPHGEVAYTVSHAHDCRWIGSFPQTDQDWSINMRHALAFTTEATGLGIGPDNYGWNYNNVPVSSLLQWFPDVAIGRYSGQSQAAWSVSGNDDYVVLGGEFPRVNGVAQESLVRFAVRDLAPNNRGPVPAPNAPAPSARALTGESVRIGWQSAYDMDNETLTYEVIRSGTNQPIQTISSKSNYWTYPTIGVVDRGLTPGATYTYTIRAKDPDGNVRNLGTSNSVTVAAGSSSAYSDAVVEDGATAFWRLGESSGSDVLDYAGFNDATARSGVSRGAVGAIAGDTDKASNFNGSSNGFVAANTQMATTQNFTIEAWVKTNSNQGGKIVGYGNSTSGNSSSYDRHIYMDSSGRITFGVYPNAVRTVRSPGAYNDNAWHQIVATLDETTGMTLYVDGKKVAADAGTTSAQNYQGYWRIGGDNLSGWPDRPASDDYFSGSIDDVAIYPTALKLADVQTHFELSGRDLGLPAAPTDAYGSAVYESSPDLYWRLGETAGSTAGDTSRNQSDGEYFGGVTKGTTSAVAGTNNTSADFDGNSGGVAAKSAITNPTRYSEELWFRTTTTNGGKLIGFGDQRSGLSSNYDRHVFMEDSGQLTFGVWTGQAETVTSQAAFNDGDWHHMVATQGVDGMRLYVDGVLVGQNDVTTAQAYTGYWRVGGDTVWSGSSNYFDGNIDEVAIYGRALAPNTVQEHYLAGGGTVPNQEPVAKFGWTATGRTVEFDASNSTDDDGSLVEYRWSFGDGATGTGVTPQHAYDADGVFQVTLTVEDDQGAESSITHDVDVTNQSPTAAFTLDLQGDEASVDASASEDPEGDTLTYDWDWGDGSHHGTGVQASHTYEVGTYEVTLTVTDSAGASATSSQQVVVVAPPAELALDAFQRSVTNAWGTADIGGDWVRKGGASNFNVGGGAATLTMPNAGSGPRAYLAELNAAESDSVVTLSMDKVVDGNGSFAYLIGRDIDGVGDYRAVLNLRPNGAVRLGINRTPAAGAATAIVPTGVVSGLTYDANQQLKLRMLVEQSGQETVLKVKVWAAGEAEPQAWTAATTDSTQAFQSAGSVGLGSYLSGNSSGSPLVASFDDLRVTAPE